MTSQPQAGRPSSQRSGPVPAALTYEFRVEGHLDDHWSAWLGDLTITRHHDGTSTLTAPVADQAQLHGVLARLRDIGATLLSLNALEASPLPASLDPLAESQEGIMGSWHPPLPGCLTSWPAIRPSRVRPTQFFRTVLAIRVSCKRGCG
jgi:hypothetical protein